MNFKKGTSPFENFEKNAKQMFYFLVNNFLAISEKFKKFFSCLPVCL